MGLRDEPMQVKLPKVMDLYASRTKVGEITELNGNQYRITLHQRVDIKQLNTVLEQYAESLNRDVSHVLLTLNENDESSLIMELKDRFLPRKLHDNPQA